MFIKIALGHLVSKPKRIHFENSFPVSYSMLLSHFALSNLRQLLVFIDVNEKNLFCCTIPIDMIERLRKNSTKIPL